MMDVKICKKKERIYLMLLQEERGKSAISTENSTILSLYAKKTTKTIDRQASNQTNTQTTQQRLFLRQIVLMHNFLLSSLSK